MDASEIFGAVASQLTKNSLLRYHPNPNGQESFHKSPKHGRLLIGDNRSGKSVAGVIESIWRLTGTHPYLETPKPPVFGRVITVDIEYGINQIIIPKLQEWLPSKYLINESWEKSYNARSRVLTLENGSKVEFKAHAQNIESFAGTNRHFLWCDEEPPKDIFIESQLRLLDFNGCWWITATLLEGLTWINEDFIEKESQQHVETFTIRVRDNPNISKEATKVMEESLGDEEKQIRLEGKILPRGGLVFKAFDTNKHVIDELIPPKEWKWYVSIDHGLNNPTAILWHAVSPQGNVITFLEHYMSDWTISQHCEKVHEINKTLGKTPYLYVGDPAMAQRQATTGVSLLVTYRENGIPIAPGKNALEGGLDKMRDYLRLRRWLITKNCPNTIREMKQYHYKKYRSQKIADRSNKQEVPNKKNDHTIDSARYFFSFMPQLNYEYKKEIEKPIMQGSHPINTKTNTVYPWQIDRQLFRQKEPEMGWGEIP